MNEAAFRRPCDNILHLGLLVDLRHYDPLANVGLTRLRDDGIMQPLVSLEGFAGWPLVRKELPDL